MVLWCNLGYNFKLLSISWLELISFLDICEQKTKVQRVFNIEL